MSEEDNENVIEIGAGMEEALMGGLFKCAKSTKFSRSMEAASKAFKTSDEELWNTMFNDLRTLLSMGADAFPLELPSNFSLDRFARQATGILYCLNAFEFAMEGFAELMAMRMEKEEVENQFKQDNA